MSTQRQLPLFEAHLVDPHLDQTPPSSGANWADGGPEVVPLMTHHHSSEESAQAPSSENTAPLPATTPVFSPTASVTPAVDGDVFTYIHKDTPAATGVHEDTLAATGRLATLPESASESAVASTTTSMAEAQPVPDMTNQPVPEPITTFRLPSILSLDWEMLSDPRPAEFVFHELPTQHRWERVHQWFSAHAHEVKVPQEKNEWHKLAQRVMLDIQTDWHKSLNKTTLGGLNVGGDNSLGVGGDNGLDVNCDQLSENAQQLDEQEVTRLLHIVALAQRMMEKSLCAPNLPSLSIPRLIALIIESHLCENKLYFAHLRLLHKIGVRAQMGGADRQDVLQDMSVRFLYAVRTFKPERGCRFLTYLYNVLTRAASRLDKKLQQGLIVSPAQYRRFIQWLTICRNHDIHDPAQSSEQALLALLPDATPRKLKLWLQWWKAYQPVSLQDCVSAQNNGKDHRDWNEVIADAHEHPEESVICFIEQQHLAESARQHIRALPMEEQVRVAMVFQNHAWAYCSPYVAYLAALPPHLRSQAAASLQRFAQTCCSSTPEHLDWTAISVHTIALWAKRALHPSMPDHDQAAVDILVLSDFYAQAALNERVSVMHHRLAVALYRLAAAQAPKNAFARRAFDHLVAHGIPDFLRVRETSEPVTPERHSQTARACFACGQANPRPAAWAQQKFCARHEPDGAGAGCGIVSACMLGKGHPRRF